MRATTWRLLIAISLLAGAAAAVAGDDMPAYPCHRNATAPVLDGVLAGDPGWENIPGATGYHHLGDGYTVAKQTTAYVTWDNANLWVGVVAEEPDIAQVKSTVKDGGDCWLDDGMEIFVQPEGKEPMQFVVTAAGYRCSGAGNAPLSAWAAKTSHTDNTYSVELRLPFAVFGVTPKAGSVWRANYCRNTFTQISGGDRFTTWAPLVSAFLEPEHFPSLRFEAGELSEAECAKTTEALNAAYRANLMAQLDTLSAAAKEYVPLLTEAANNPKYADQASPLKAEWRKVVRLQREASRAPAPEVRQILGRSEDLTKKSYEFKYEMLMKELFED